MIEIDPLMGLRMINDGSVSLLSTRREGKTNVSTVSWQMPLSQDPPMLGISLTPSCLSNELLRESGEFVLSIPDASLIAETHYCGTHRGDSEDKVRSMQFRTMRARKVIPLLVTNCIGHLECAVRDVYPFGDRLFYASRVVAALVEEDYFDNGWNENAQTLHHLGGDRYKTGGGILDAKIWPLPQQMPNLPPLF
ncbi:MAG: flavin reductase family protein [Candidatus Omnitrophica bacterium]|nr:flavin reductase family protein [Candidatus Omnitrophota bacterium]